MPSQSVFIPTIDLILNFNLNKEKDEIIIYSNVFRAFSRVFGKLQQLWEAIAKHPLNAFLCNLYQKKR